MRRIKRAALTAGLLLGLATLTSGVRAEPNHFEQVRAAAEAGDPASQTALGNMYHDGFGMPKDIAQALDWYREAAAQGHAEGQYRLGHEYATGHGVPADAGKAMELFTQAAEQGHVKAQYRLGRYYYDGKEVSRDLEKAYDWLSEAAENGSTDAQYLIGSHFLSIEELEAALPWFERAAPQHEDAALKAAAMYYHGLGAPKNHGRTAELVKPLIHRNVNAKSLYGQLLLQGQGVAKDSERGGKYLAEAAENGALQAMVWLADAMYDGQIVSPGVDLAAAYSDESVRDLMRQEARQWYEKAAAAGHPEAKARLQRYN